MQTFLPLFSAFALPGLLLACGPPPPPAATPVSDVVMPATNVVPRDLGGLAAGDCKTKTFLDQLTTCSALPMAQVNGTDTANNIASVSDGDACTGWSSGHVPPQSVEIDLGQTKGITALLLVPDLTPATGDTWHDIRIEGEGDKVRAHLNVTGSMTSGHGYTVQMPAGTDGRFVKIATLKAPGTVGWREIVPLACK